MNEKLLEENFRKEVNTNENIKIYEYNRDLKCKDETLNQIILQYDDKMKRLSSEMEANGSKILSLTEKNKKLTKELEDMKASYENEKRGYEISIQTILQSCSEIGLQVKNTLELDLSDETLKEDVFTKIKEEIKKINKQEEWKWLTESRSLFSKILMNHLEAIYKQINLEDNLASAKIKWQQTLDQIVLSHEEEINQSNIY